MVIVDHVFKFGRNDHSTAKQIRERRSRLRGNYVGVNEDVG